MKYPQDIQNDDKKRKKGHLYSLYLCLLISMTTYLMISKIKIKIK